jgi:hypothetical protein
MALVVRSSELALALPVGILADVDSGSVVGTGIGDRSTDGDSGESEDESEKLHCDCGGVKTLVVVVREVVCDGVEDELRG